jgi:exonuclease SbcC
MSPEQAQELQDELADYKGELRELKKSKTDSTRLAAKKVGSVAEIKKEIADLEKKLEKAEKIFDEHSEKDERLELLEGSIEYFIAYEAAEKAIDTLTKKIDAMKVKAGIESDEELDDILEYDRDELEDEIKKYNESLVEVTARLKGMKDLPAPDGLQSEIDTINEQKKSLDDLLSAVQTRIAIATTITTALDEARAGVMAAYDELDALITQAAPYKAMDALVSGGSGSKLTLTNFVLQERLEMVLEISNNHLRNISNGKYEFELSERAINKRKKQAGLDIKVTNIMAGKTRPAETLSGGETFYASLALALGLAEVVKMSNGGIELGTIFIDEGFGSLSEETLEEVLGVLENLREDRFIGIISHVDSMKTRFPMRLEVRPTDAGPSTTHISTSNND